MLKPGKSLYCVAFFTIISLTSGAGAFEPGHSRTNRNTAVLFLDLLYYNQSTFPGTEWEKKSEKGASTLELKDTGTEAANVKFTVDKKNWYALEENWGDALKYTNEAGIYFKADGSPVIAVSHVGGDGYRTITSEISFFAFRCTGVSAAKDCELTEITQEIFPKVTATDFLATTPAARKILAQFDNIENLITIEYKIPRTGTTIVALPATTGTRCQGECKVGKISAYASMHIQWQKKKNRFEKGAKQKGVIKLYEN